MASDRTRKQPEGAETPNTKAAPPRVKAALRCRTPGDSGMDRIEFVVHSDLLSWEIVDCLDLCRSRRSLKPRCGAPPILIGNQNQSVLDGVLVDVVQTSQVRLLERQLSLSEVEPDLSPRLLIESIDRSRRLTMKLLQ